MRPLSIVACACLLLAGCARPAAGGGAGELHVSVRLTTGEHSKDSGSETTAITVGRDAISWEQTFGGSSRGRSVTARKKSYKLSAADKRSLVGLIESNNLLVTDSIKLPRAASNYRYFEISVDLTVGGKTGAISLSGMRTAAAVRGERLYQNTLALVRELYRIINAQDKSVRFEELILEPVG